MPLKRFLFSKTTRWCMVFLNSIIFSQFLESCSYSAKTTQKLLKASESTVYDMVVVPGEPLVNGKWSMSMRRRIYWAKYLYDRGIAKNIMFSGSAVYTPFYEGIVMALYAVALGIPPENVFSETRAEHSTENIYYSYYKAKALGYSKIALASGPFQVRTLRRFARKRLSPDIAMLPMVADIMKKLEPTMIDPVVDIQLAYKKDFISLKKRESFFKRMKGTMGYNIK